MRLAFIPLAFLLASIIPFKNAYTQSGIEYPDGFPEQGREVLATQFSAAEIESLTDGYESKIGPVYRVRGTMEGKKLEVMLDFDGNLVEDLRIEEIPAEEVPKPCLEAAHQNFPDVNIEKMERLMRNGELQYRIISEVEQADEGVWQQWVLVAAPNGEVLKYYRADKVVTPKKPKK